MIRPVRPDGRIETGGTFKPIPRPRVVERIASAAVQRVALIVAPAGYGKSVALSQYLKESDEPWLRFDLHPEHDTLPGFLRGLAEAVAEAAPEARQTFAGAYERNRASPSAGADLALWMDSHLAAYRGVIAIDDLHVAEGDPQVARFIAALIDRTKVHIRWILSTRSTTGLPVGSWLAYGDSDLSVDEHDLRFSTEEAKAAASAFRLGVREEELQSLLDLTDGWPTALSFALRTSTRSVDLRSITSMTREMIYQYLAEQVYRALSDEERAFLEATALLSEIDIDTMVAVGFDRAAKLIADLRERVAFLYEARPGVYRCHDLFRDFILHQLSLEGETVTNRLRCSIAAALESLGRIPSALRLYADAGAEDSVLRMIDAQGFDLLAKGHTDLVLAAVEAIGEERRNENSILLALRGVLEASSGRLDDAEPLLQRSLRLSGDPALRANVAMRLALLRINQGRDATPVLDDLIVDETIANEMRLEALALRAVVAARAGEVQTATALLERIEREGERVEDEDSIARTLQRVGVAAWELRDAQRARFALSRSAEIAKRRSLHSLACRALDILALEACYCENDVELAAWYAQQAATAAAKAGDIFDMHTETLRMLYRELWRGNLDRVVALERQAAEMRTSDSSRGIYLVESHAYRHAWEGRFAEAHRIFAGIVDRQVHSVDAVLTRALYALCLALDEKSKESKEESAATIGLLDAQRGTRDGFASLLLEIAQLLAALAETVAGRKTIAKRILKRPSLSTRSSALAMREATEHLCRGGDGASCTDHDFAYAVGRMQEHGLGGFAQFLMKARKALEQAPGSAEVRLTETEARILQLLARGMTQKAIAAEMERSVLTIQTHIQNLVEKLGCHGRAQAIAAARRLGLLA